MRVSKVLQKKWKFVEFLSNSINLDTMEFIMKSLLVLYMGVEEHMEIGYNHIDDEVNTDVLVGGDISHIWAELVLKTGAEVKAPSFLSISTLHKMGRVMEDVNEN